MFLLWNAKYPQTKKSATAHTPAAEKVCVANVFIITGKWDNFPPVSFQKKLKRHMTVPWRTT